MRLEGKVAIVTGDALVQTALDRFGQLDILVNNAGQTIARGLRNAFPAK